MTPPPAADGGSRDAHGTAPHAAANAIPFDRLRGRPLALMLDVDGTLAPIAPNQEV